MVLVASGVGRIISPLVLAYLVAFGYVLVGVLEGREPLPAVVEQPGGSDGAGPQDEAESNGSGRAGER